jgi:hypothetical protein
LLCLALLVSFQSQAPQGPSFPRIRVLARENPAEDNIGASVATAVSLLDKSHDLKHSDSGSPNAAVPADYNALQKSTKPKSVISVKDLKRWFESKRHGNERARAERRGMAANSKTAAVKEDGKSEF